MVECTLLKLPISQNIGEEKLRTLLEGGIQDLNIHWYFSQLQNRLSFRLKLQLHLRGRFVRTVIYNLPCLAIARVLR